MAQLAVCAICGGLVDDIGRHHVVWGGLFRYGSGRKRSNKTVVMNRAEMKATCQVCRACHCAIHRGDLLPVLVVS